MRINEVYVDVDLQGDRVEYVELKGPVGEPLAGLFLRLLRGDAGVLYDVAVTSNDAGVIDSTGLWVVGGALAACNTDQTYGLTSWGLDNSSGAVELVKRAGAPELIDVVGYGGLATNEGAPIGLPSDAGVSLGRKTSASESDVTTTDFCVQNFSCGAANNSCL